ncbi:hypothetical protein GH714_040080 [Hevea brasiliensis]|uniref:beta-carotene 3-hydroxylase n=1 Tax=Hevea brasiliensis TaxID=3981 RepID=A0A6A6MP98_HEVBR|nr:hypothetical protein GH714_040080 [Hevea brasiliensis]
MTPRAAERLARKRSERFTYLVAAVMSSFGITSMAIMACYYRFYWQMEGGEVPLLEMFGTFSLSVGAAEWSFGQDGLIELSGMLPCGICTRSWNYGVWDGLHVVHDGLVHKRFPVGPLPTCRFQEGGCGPPGKRYSWDDAFLITVVTVTGLRDKTIYVAVKHRKGN